MERDLDMAHEVQLRLMPQAVPQPANADLACSFSPARSIGGDLYDFLDYGAAPDLGDAGQAQRETRPSSLMNAESEPQVILSAALTRTLIVLGDVSGKAAPAALYAALVSGILRSLAPQRLTPAHLLTALNTQLQERKLDGQYVTMLIALWDDATRILHIANAGSVQPMLLTRRSPTDETPSLTNGLDVHNIPVAGFPLGMFAHADYDELHLQLGPGDLVVFFSDGITDAANSRGEQYGEERLCTLLNHHPIASTSARASVDAILEAVTTHQSGTPHFDDETIVALRVR